MEGLARAGNGTSEFVKEGERMQPKVSTKMRIDGHMHSVHIYYVPN